MSPAVTSPSSVAFRWSVFGPLVWFLITTPFKFKIIVATSSYTPSIVWNSWRTPSILILLIALPGNEDNITLLKALPIVLPKPLSNGSSSNFP